MFYLISFLFPLLYFLLFTSLLVHLTRRSFGKCLPLGMITTALILFVSQLLFKTFSIGFVLCIILAIASIPIAITKRKSLASFKEKYFTGGLIAFLVIYVLVFIFDFNRGLAAWDELSHWGMMVKEMFRLDSFYSSPESNLTVHKDYPPILPLLELFWTKLCGGYYECILQRALHTFEFSLIIPLLVEKAKRTSTLKNVIASLLLTFGVSFFILAFDLHKIFNTIYTDYALSLVVVYALLVIFWSKHITWFELFVTIVAGCFLLLAKQIGLPIYLLLCASLSVYYYLSLNQKPKTFVKSNYKKLLISLLVLLSPFLFFLAWSHIASAADKQFDSSSALNDLITLLSKRGEPWQAIAAYNFIDALAEYNLLDSTIKLGYIQHIIVVACLSWLLRRKQNKSERVPFSHLVVLLLLGSIAYAFMMLVLYATSFGPDEGPKLASYERYMSTYLLIMYLFLLCTTLNNFSFKTRSLVLTLAIGAVLVSPSGLMKLYPVFKKPSPTHYNLIAQDLTATVESDSNIYFVSKTRGPEQGYQYFVQYYATPIKLSWHSEEISWHSHYWDVDPESNHKEAFESYKQEMKQADYLLFTDIDDSFKKYYAPLLKINSPEDGQLYRINKDSAGEVLNFELVTSLEHY